MKQFFDAIFGGRTKKRRPSLDKNLIFSDFGEVIMGTKELSDIHKIKLPEKALSPVNSTGNTFLNFTTPSKRALLLSKTQTPDDLTAPLGDLYPANDMNALEEGLGGIGSVHSSNNNLGVSRSSFSLERSYPSNHSISSMSYISHDDGRSKRKGSKPRNKMKESAISNNLIHTIADEDEDVNIGYPLDDTESPTSVMNRKSFEDPELIESKRRDAGTNNYSINRNTTTRSSTIDLIIREKQDSTADLKELVRQKPAVSPRRRENKADNSGSRDVRVYSADVHNDNVEDSKEDGSHSSSKAGISAYPRTEGALSEGKPLSRRLSSRPPRPSHKPVSSVPQNVDSSVNLQDLVREKPVLSPRKKEARGDAASASSKISGNAVIAADVEGDAVSEFESEPHRKEVTGIHRATDEKRLRGDKSPLSPLSPRQFAASIRGEGGSGIGAGAVIGDSSRKKPVSGHSGNREKGVGDARVYSGTSEMDGNFVLLNDQYYNNNHNYDDGDAKNESESSPLQGRPVTPHSQPMELTRNNTHLTGFQLGPEKVKPFLSDEADVSLPAVTAPKTRERVLSPVKSRGHLVHIDGEVADAHGAQSYSFLENRNKNDVRKNRDEDTSRELGNSIRSNHSGSSRRYRTDDASKHSTGSAVVAAQGEELEEELWVRDSSMKQIKKHVYDSPEMTPRAVPSSLVDTV